MSRSLSYWVLYQRLTPYRGTPSQNIPLPDFSSLPPPPHGYGSVPPSVYTDTDSDISQSHAQAQLQTTLDVSSEAYAATRRANVLTLKQMFPALDEDVLDAVLGGCGDDLGLAIDRLLEM